MKHQNFLEVKGVNLGYGKGHDVVRAVQNVSFTIPNTGQVLAIVGESGCGKSSLFKVLLRLLDDNVVDFSGEVFLGGEDILALSEGEFRKKIRHKRVAWVPQNVMGALPPTTKIGSQIKKTIKLHLGKAKATDDEVKRLLEAVGLKEEDARHYPHELSGGMLQRVVMAIAIAIKPDLIILDEPTSALDVSRQGQVLDLLSSLQKEYEASYIIITHDIGVARKFSDIFAVMYAGRIVEFGTTDQVISNPLHPYTQKLLECVPTLGSKEIKWIEGEPPDLTNDCGGCPFRSRPAIACDDCSDVEPELVDIGNGHLVACHGVNNLQ